MDVYLRLFVHSYREVKYCDVYPGIDLVFILNEGANQFVPEYKWIIHPNGNPQSIELTYQGQKEIQITKQGSLLLGKNNWKYY
jgi:hypothetical protein